MTKVCLSCDRRGCQDVRVGAGGCGRHPHQQGAAAPQPGGEESEISDFLKFSLKRNLKPFPVQRKSWIYLFSNILKAFFLINQSLKRRVQLAFYLLVLIFI